MPSLNFDYTQFLKKQNALYLLKYQNDAIQTPTNPLPITGYGGYVPTYRSSIHEQRMVRSLVRCMNSSTKPTTANGYESANARFPELERSVSTAVQRSKENVCETKEDKPDKEKSFGSKLRAQTAPSGKRSDSQLRLNSPRAAPNLEKTQKHVKLRPTSGAANERPVPSRLSMMSAGTSDYICNDAWMRPYSAAPSIKTYKPPAPPIRQLIKKPEERPSAREPPTPPSCQQFKKTEERPSSGVPPTPPNRQQIKQPEERPSSRVPSIAERPMTQAEVQKHPTGNLQTLYGTCFQYSWPDTTPKTTFLRRKSYDEDHKLNRNDNVIYHKHEGVVPKYMGYVPGYKFRHGSTYGVLTSHATDLGVAHNRKRLHAN